MTKRYNAVDGVFIVATPAQQAYVDRLARLGATLHNAGRLYPVMPMSFLRRVRGVVMTAAMWGTAFALAGVSVGVVLDIMGLTQPLDLPRLIDVLMRVAVRWGRIGAGMGGLFATTIILTQRERTVAELSVSRFSLLGLAAGAVVSFAVSLLILLSTGRSLTNTMTPALVIAAVCGAIGAGVATSTLRLARRAKEPVVIPG